MKSLRSILITVMVVSLLVLVYLSYDSTAQLQKRTPTLTEKVVKGKEAWQRNNCINCHTILGNGAYFAPDLTKTAAKRSEKWLSGFLAFPDKVWPGTVMANISLTSQDAQNLAAFLVWVNDVDTNGWPPKPLTQMSAQKDQAFSTGTGDRSGASVDEGKSVFDSAGCAGCHQVNGIGGKMAADLTKIGNARDKEWLGSFLKNPQQVKPGTMMPAANVSGEALDALVEYLASLK